MSDDYGLVKFKTDGRILCFCYDGTSDMCVPNLYANQNDVFKRNKKWAECNCKHAEDVEIYSNYGGGFYWQGKACRICKAIKEGLKPYDCNIVDGKPQWVIDYEKEMF